MAPWTRLIIVCQPAERGRERGSKGRGCGRTSALIGAAHYAASSCAQVRPHCEPCYCLLPRALLRVLATVSMCVCVCKCVCYCVCVFAPYRCVYLLPSICVWKRVNCVQDFALSAIRLSRPRQHAPPTLSTCPSLLTSLLPLYLVWALPRWLVLIKMSL